MIRHVTKTRGFLRAVLTATIGLPLLVGASLYAQQAGPGAAEAERVIVTGSNIPTAEEVTASPLDTITTQDLNIASQGSDDILTVLQKRNPDFVGGGNLGSTNANISSGATQGGSFVSLRGLPTLVLFEGRRIVDSSAISAGGFQFTDVSIFPTSLISRIDVLKDGASALYGSEAVGGVINIFMKDDFNGVEVGGRYGFTVESAVQERKGYVIAGVGNDTTHVTVGVQYHEIDPLFARERAYSIPNFGGLTTTYAGVGRDNAGGGTNFYLLNGGLNSPFDAPGVTPGSIPPPPPDSGTANPGQYALLPQAYSPATQNQVTAFPLSSLPTSTLGIENTDAYLSLNHQIFGKQLEFFGNFLYANNHNENFLNAQPLGNGTGIVILGSQRVDPATGTLVPENRGAPAAFNPFQESIDGNTLSGNYRLFANNRYQTNPRIFTQNTDFYRILTGLRSEFAKGWNAEIATYYSKYNINFINDNLVNALQLNAMIAGTAVDNSGVPIPALDFFARNPVGTGPGQVSQSQFATIFGKNFRNEQSYQGVFDAKISGFPLKLPGGDLGVAFGGEYRREGFKVQDSPEIFVGSVPIQEINAGRYIDSFYAEIDVPIIGSPQQIPGIYSLSVDLAGRYDHYEGVDEDAKVPKVTLRYQPIQDVTLRATYSNSFIAPNLFQLDGPTTQGFSPSITLNGHNQDQAQVLAGSNPDLVPSKAESYTAGIVYSPHFVPGLTVSADYFRTLQQQIVGTIGGSTILNSVQNAGPSSPYANLVAFNNFPGQPGARPVTGPGQLDGNLASVFYIDNLVNIGAVRVEGFDFAANYALDLRQWGQARFGVQAVLFTLQDAKLTQFSDYYNQSNLDFAEGGGALPDYKINALFGYTFQGASLALNANYIPGLVNANGRTPSLPEDQSLYPRIGDYFTVDGRLAYEFHAKPVAPPVASYSKDAKDSKEMVAGENQAGTGPAVSPLDKLIDGLTVAVGCNNIFDRTPPLVDGGNSNTDLSVYDPYGRFVYFEVSKKF